MNRIPSVLVAIVAMTFPLQGRAGKPGEPVVVKTHDLPPHIARGVESAAAQGQDALRRYVERTQKIYQLDITRIVATPEEIAAMKAARVHDPAKMAEEKAPTR